MIYTTDVINNKPTYKQNLYQFVNDVTRILGGKDLATEWIKKKKKILEDRNKLDLILFEKQLSDGTLE